MIVRKDFSSSTVLSLLFVEGKPGICETNVADTQLLKCKYEIDK